MGQAQGACSIKEETGWNTQASWSMNNLGWKSSPISLLLWSLIACSFVKSPNSFGIKPVRGKGSGIRLHICVHDTSRRTFNSIFNGALIIHYCTRKHRTVVYILHFIYIYTVDIARTSRVIYIFAFPMVWNTRWKFIPALMLTTKLILRDIENPQILELTERRGEFPWGHKTWC